MFGNMNWGSHERNEQYFVPDGRHVISTLHLRKRLSARPRDTSGVIMKTLGWLELKVAYFKNVDFI
jgi:hypothetical protein